MSNQTTTPQPADTVAYIDATISPELGRVVLVPGWTADDGYVLVDWGYRVLEEKTVDLVITHRPAADQPTLSAMLTSALNGGH